MDTSVCFVLLLVIGLSAQRSILSLKSEFQIEFEYLVNQIRLQDGKGTLLNCLENCDKVTETACKCVHFDHCMNGTIYTCISTGLQRLKFSPSEEFHEALNTSALRTPPADPEQWQKPVSPRVFLNYIQEQYQKSNVLKSK